MPKPLIPSVPYEEARVISAKISPEFHKQLREFAAQKDCLVSKVIRVALQQYITGAH